MKEMRKYIIEIFYSDEDEGFIAVAPELAGCWRLWRLKEDALHEIEIAMDLWLETAKKEGRNIPRPRGRELLAGVLEKKDRESAVS